MRNQSKNQNRKEEGQETKRNETINAIEKMGQINIPSYKSNIQNITIIGQIEGHLISPPQNKTTKYEHIIPQILSIDENPEIEGLLLIKYYGGDVEALAISELISSIQAKCFILGGGHSIGFHFQFLLITHTLFPPLQ